MNKEEAIKYFKEMKDECNDTIHKVRYVTQEEALEMAIKALSQEPKTGHWFAWKPEDDVWRTTCSECGEETRTLWDYCPHCGAKMVEPREERDKE